jgi:hypothetical protein
MGTPAYSAPTSGNSPRSSFSDAVHFWEPRRILYNAVLGAVFVAWLALSWPHFRGVFSIFHLVQFAVLALIANVLYCLAYFVDIPMQLTSVDRAWRRWRWSLWILGAMLAVLLENYWIADEIYPFVK